MHSPHRSCHPHPHHLPRRDRVLDPYTDQYLHTVGHPLTIRDPYMDPDCNADAKPHPELHPSLLLPYPRSVMCIRVCGPPEGKPIGGAGLLGTQPEAALPTSHPKRDPPKALMHGQRRVQSSRARTHGTPLPASRPLGAEQRAEPPRAPQAELRQAVGTVHQKTSCTLDPAEAKSSRWSPVSAPSRPGLPSPCPL